MTLAPPEVGAGAAATAVELAATALTLARRFASGATLWCVAPGRPAHARHVAVEFVHPVIVGKTALPAVALTDGDPVALVRAAARRGDVVLVIGDANGAAVTELLRRAPAWGVLTLWLGADERPPPGAADHVNLVPGDCEVAVVRGYHLLWELTHVCFEHPHVLAPPVPEAAACITCADEGRLGEVQEVRGTDASVLIDGECETVDLGLVGDVGVHDLVIVHAGVAIERLDPGVGR